MSSRVFGESEQLCDSGQKSFGVVPLLNLTIDGLQKGRRELTYRRHSHQPHSGIGLAQFLGKFIAVHPGHTIVEERKGEVAISSRDGQGLFRGCGGRDPVAGGLKEESSKFEGGGIVVHTQHALGQRTHNDS
jgi:hypothetical protein